MANSTTSPPKLETAEPDPAATSLDNGDSVNEKQDRAADAEAIAPLEAPAAEGVVSDQNTGDTSGKAESSAAAETGGKEGTAEGKDEEVVKGDIAKDESPNRSHKRSYNDRNDTGSFKKYKSYREDRGKNVKSDLTSLPESSDPDEIRKQVEFYFSDSNLPTDKFLLGLVGGSKNNPVPIKVIHSFKRMRHFLPYSAVVAALKDSTFLDITDDEEIKRKVPLPEQTKEDAMENLGWVNDKTIPRSIYAKGFGQEGPSTQFDVEAFFTPYGPYNAVRLRRTQERMFKGSVFVEFDSEVTQKAFLALDPKPKYKGQELKIMSKRKYVEMKGEQYKDKPVRRYNKSERFSRKDNDERDWRDRRDEDRKNDSRNDIRNGGRGGRGRGRGGRGRGDGDRRGDRGDRARGVPDRNEEKTGDAQQAIEARPTETAQSKYTEADKSSEKVVTEAPVEATVETSQAASVEPSQAQNDHSEDSKKRIRDDEESTADEVGAKKAKIDAADAT